MAGLFASNGFIGVCPFIDTVNFDSSVSMSVRVMRGKLFSGAAILQQCHCYKMD
ncbi:hypothetical protein D3C84_716130 [compost metagenome]